MTAESVAAAAANSGYNVRVIDEKTVGISMGEGITKADLEGLLKSGFNISNPDVSATEDMTELSAARTREGEIMTHPIFHQVSGSGSQRRKQLYHWAWPRL